MSMFRNGPECMKDPRPASSSAIRKTAAGMKRMPVSNVSPCTGPSGASFFISAYVANDDGERQRDPRHRAERHRQIRHAGSRQRNGYPLQPPKPLVEHHHAENDAEQRVDEIAEADLHDLVDADRPHENQPVGGNGDGGYRVDDDDARRAHRLPHDVKLLRSRDHHGQHQERPDDAMADELERRNAAERFPVDRKEPPERV